MHVNYTTTAELLYSQGVGFLPEVSTLLTFLETKHWFLWQGRGLRCPANPEMSGPFSNGSTMAAIRGGGTIYHRWWWHSEGQLGGAEWEDELCWQSFRQADVYILTQAQKFTQRALCETLPQIQAAFLRSSEVISKQACRQELYEKWFCWYLIWLGCIFQI